MKDKERLYAQLLEIYREFYKHELEWKEKLSGRFPMLLAIYTLLIGVIAFYLNNLPDNDGSTLARVFYLTLIAQGMAILYSLGYAVVFLYLDKRPSLYVRTAAGIDDYIREPQGFNKTAKPVERVDIPSAIRQYMVQQYSVTSTQNFKENKDRQAIFGTALGAVIVAASLALISAIPYFVIRSQHTVRGREIEILKTSEDTMFFKWKRKGHKTNQEPKAATKSDSTTKPDNTSRERPKPPSVLSLRDSDTTKQALARGENDGVW